MNSKKHRWWSQISLGRLLLCWLLCGALAGPLWVAYQQGTKATPEVVSVPDGGAVIIGGMIHRLGKPAAPLIKLGRAQTARSTKTRLPKVTVTKRVIIQEEMEELVR